MRPHPLHPETQRLLDSQSREVAEVVRRNIRALVELRHEYEARKGLQDRMADAITRFTGSMPFVYLHAALFGGWILLNSGVAPGIRPWDPFPFVMLAMIASVEAIFLSTFVLISQNRMTLLAERRADLDLQISLLTEHEVTRILALVDAIAAKMDLHVCDEAEVAELKADVRPEVLLHEIEEAEEEVEAAAEASER